MRSAGESSLDAGSDVMLHHDIDEPAENQVYYVIADWLQG
jgi:hypothetical protein